MANADQNKVNRYQSNQYQCVKCGFRTSAVVFDKRANSDDSATVECPECGSDEIIDADTKAMINTR